MAAKQIVGQDQFNAEVVNSKLPVMVDFMAEWCGPCQVAGPILNRLATEFDGKVTILKLDVDEEENREIAQQFGVRSIPTVISFKAGAVSDKKIGFIGEDGYRSMVEEAMQ